MKLAKFVSALLFVASSALADYPKPQEGSWIAKDFRFSTGEVMPEVRLHYLEELLRSAPRDSR